MKSLITRADDFGSSHAANEAIYRAMQTGFVRNVSVMACGNFIEEAAELAAGQKQICFGLHGCITSEWSKVYWGPVAPREKVRSLVDDRGAFYPSQQDLVTHQIKIEEAITEYRYQLEQVRKLGIPIRYVDSHMFPELFVPGLAEAMSRMIEQEGLIDHKYFNRVFPGGDLINQEKSLFEQNLQHMAGQYLFVMHPARDGAEMRETGNHEVSGAVVAENREKDYRFMTDPKNLELCKQYGVKLLRYDEAEKLLDSYTLNLSDFQRRLEKDDILSSVSH